MRLSSSSSSFLSHSCPQHSEAVELSKFFVCKTMLALRECYLSETGITAETYYCCQDLGISKAWSPAKESLKERLKGKAFRVVAKTRIRFVLPCEVTQEVVKQYREEPFLSNCKH